MTAGLCQGPTTITLTDDNGCVAQQVLNISVPACLTDVDFGTWQLVGNPANGNWLVQAGGAQLRQTVNGNPTFFVTPVDYINVRMKGRMRTTDGDDDFIGVVFGLKQPLGNSTQYDTWLFDWKQTNQNSNGFVGYEGFALSRILGNIPNTTAALSPTFWGHTNTPEFTVVATDYSTSNGFVRNQYHDIEVLYTTTRAVIIVDNDTIFDIADCFEPGRFGFYNYSQPDVYYTDFTYELFTSFELEADEVCVGDTTRITFFEPCSPNNDLTQFDELRWDFGDGTTFTNNAITVDNVNPTHVYAAAGNYTIRLIALDNLGCRDTVYRSVEILPLPNPNFNVTDQCFQDVTQFTDASNTGGYPITGWQWDLGDGSTSALQDVSHTYAASGTYNVSLIATDAFGCQDTVIQPTDIYALPVAAFAFVGVCDGEPMDLLDVSQDVSGIVTTTWDLGDGSTATTPLVSHLYAAAGTYSVTLDVTSGEGCLAQITQPVTVYPNPVADFTTTQVCAGLETDLTDVSTVAAPSTITAWAWDIINNGTVEFTTQNAQHTFGLGGTYDVSLTVTTDAGCNATLVVPVMSDPIPSAIAAATEACLGQPNDLSDQSMVAFGTIDAWEWDFGDGSAVDNTQNPSHIYAAFGTYDVTLTVTSDRGCTDNVSLQAIVHQLPVPAFAPIDDCFALNYPFTDASTIGAGTLTAWDWDFGDGTTGSVQDPTHSYPTFGTYSVQLTVTSSEGCTDSITQDIVLHDNPVAGFVVPAVCQQEPVAIQDTSSIQEGAIVAWSWTFAGGGTSSDQNPTHAFLASGNVNVQLTVTSDFGCTGSTTVAVPVHPKPNAAFTAPDVCLDEETVITDQSTVATGTIVSLAWELSDGTTETSSTFNHLFTPAGTYDITLMVETDQGCRDTLIAQTEVHRLPTADFSFADVCLDANALFTDQSIANSGQVDSWQWDLGDGASSTDAGPVAHAYAAEGTYDVTLIVGTNFGCSDTILQSIIIHPMPVANFSADSVCFGLETSFTDLSTITNGTIAGHSWLFGGGQGSETSDPVHTFPNTGYTDVDLTVSSEFGCSDQITLPIRVYVLPEPEFAAFDTCAGKEIQFTNQSVITEGAISTYAWTFGDGTTTSLSGPVHTYITDGNYTVSLVATSNFGCVDSISHSIEVFALPIPSFTTDPAEGCIPLSVSMTNTSTIANGYSIAGYAWRFGNGNTANVTDPGTVYTVEGNYDITLIATSNKGCVDSLTVADAVVAWPKPIADFRTDTLVYHMRFPKPEITEMSQGATIWHWDFGDGTEYDVQVPEHAYEEHGTYFIIETVFNDFGCSDTFGIRVIVEPNITFFIPNSFTPNADGLNDTWFGTGENIMEYENWVFNRWGQNIFYSKNKDRHWDGTLNDTPVESGMYLYKFIIKDIDNRTKVFSGEVHLIR
jgi:gliding motility-associated-like protein